MTEAVVVKSLKDRFDIQTKQQTRNTKQDAEIDPTRVLTEALVAKNLEGLFDIQTLPSCPTTVV